MNQTNNPKKIKKSRVFTSIVVFLLLFLLIFNNIRDGQWLIVTAIYLATIPFSTLAGIFSNAIYWETESETKPENVVLHVGFACIAIAACTIFWTAYLQTMPRTSWVFWPLTILTLALAITGISLILYHIDDQQKEKHEKAKKSDELLDELRPKIKSIDDNIDKLTTLLKKTPPGPESGDTNQRGAKP